MLIPASITSIWICYTYLPGVFLGPLFFLGSLYIILPYFKQTKSLLLIGLMCACTIFLPIFFAWHNTSLQTRWTDVALGKDMSFGSKFLLFCSQYVSHFSPLYLFTKGDVDYPGHYMTRFGIRNQGQIYYIDGLFAFIGICFCIVRVKKHRPLAFLLLLLILYPLASSITQTDGGPFSFRAILGSITFPIFSAIGILYVFSRIRVQAVRKFFIVLVLLGYGVSFGRYLYLYHTQYPLYSQNFAGWQYGPRDVMKTFLENKGMYDEYLLIGEFNAPEIFIRFYDPTHQCKDRCRIGGTADIDPTKRQLIAISPQSLRQIPSVPLAIQQIISYPNGQPAFYIATISK